MRGLERLVLVQHPGRLRQRNIQAREPGILPVPRHPLHGAVPLRVLPRKPRIALVAGGIQNYSERIDAELRVIRTGGGEIHLETVFAIDAGVALLRAWLHYRAPRMRAPGHLRAPAVCAP